MPTPSAAARRSIACTVCAGTSPAGSCQEFDTMEALGRAPLPVSTERAASSSAWSSLQPAPTTISWAAPGAIA